jgi:hypothetical protein
LTGPRDTDPALPVSDQALLAAQQRFDEGNLGVWELVALEKAHLGHQAPIGAGNRPRRAVVVIDKAGDAWRWGRTRWSCLSAVDGVRIVQAARLPHDELVSQYGPIRTIGEGAGWTYRTIRGRRG